MGPGKLSPQIALLWSLAMAIPLSTQYLFQPFVWQNWPWDEVLSGYLEVLWHSLLEGALVGMTLALAIGLRSRSSLRSVAALIAAVAVGAAGANFALDLVGAPGAAPDVSLVISRTIRWTALASCSLATYSLWLRTSQLRAQAQDHHLKRIQSDHQLAQARLQALRNQIEPHFLFNTLATVRRLHHTDPVQGVKLLAHFLAYLRSAMPQMEGQLTKLGREINLVEAYLGVVALRMSGRLRVSIQVPAEFRACCVPVLCVATLVENSVKHGISGMPAGGEILVLARRLGDSLEIAVCDSGVGFRGTGGSGVGLANIRARLRTLYGPQASLRLEANAPSGVRATLRLPWQASDGASGA